MSEAKKSDDELVAKMNQLQDVVSTFASKRERDITFFMATVTIFSAVPEDIAKKVGVSREEFRTRAKLGLKDTVRALRLGVLELERILKDESFWADAKPEKPETKPKTKPDAEPG